MPTFSSLNDSELGQGLSFMPQAPYGSADMAIGMPANAGNAPQVNNQSVQEVIRNPELLKVVMNYAAMQGRGGDSMLVHLRPDEYIKLLEEGGSGTINPLTGMPEAGFFSSIAKTFSNIFSNPFKAVTTVLSIAASIATGNPLAAALTLASNAPGPVGQIAGIASLANGVSSLAGLGNADQLAGTANSFSGARETVAQSLGFQPIVDPASTTYISAADQLGRVANTVQSVTGAANMAGGVISSLSGGNGMAQATTGAGNLLGSLGSSAPGQSQGVSSAQAPTAQSAANRVYGTTSGANTTDATSSGLDGKPFGQATGRFGSYSNSSYKFG